MTADRSPRVRGSRRGFTLIELLVSLVLGVIVLSGVVQMMIVQGKGYRKQREVIDVRETAREAAVLLSWDLRQSAVGGSPLEAMSAVTVVLRSPRGLGTICAKHATLARYGLWKTGGNIFAGADDSALVYQLGRDKWTPLKITAVGTPAAMGVTACAWPGARPPDVVVEFAELDKQGLHTPIPLWMERNRGKIPWVKEEYDRVKGGKLPTIAGDIPHPK